MVENTHVWYKEHSDEGRPEQHVHPNFLAVVGAKVDDENVACYMLDHTCMVYGSSYSYALKSGVHDHMQVMGVGSLALFPLHW